jgi:hypothetical protein
VKEVEKEGRNMKLNEKWIPIWGSGRLGKPQGTRVKEADAEKLSYHTTNRCIDVKYD